MLAALNVVNKSRYTVSVYVDEVLYFADILPDSARLKSIDMGSRRLVVTDGRRRKLFDLWVSASSRHTLKIFASYAIFK